MKPTTGAFRRPRATNVRMHIVLGFISVGLRERGRRFVESKLPILSTIMEHIIQAGWIHMMDGWATQLGAQLGNSFSF